MVSYSQISFAQYFNSPQEQARIAIAEANESRRLFIMVLGQTGSGKSTTIKNLLRGCYPIPVATSYGKVGASSVTTEPNMHNGQLYDCPATFIDQAGFGDTTGLTDASILGKTLVFCATQVPRQRIDGFMIVQSAEDSRSYIEANCRVVEALFGKQALMRTLVLVTKSEGLFDRSKSKIAQSKQKFESYQREAASSGGATAQLMFNSYFDEDYRELIAQHSGLEDNQHELYLPFQRMNVQQFFKAREDPSDQRVLQIKEIYNEIVYQMRLNKGSVKEVKKIIAKPSNKVLQNLEQGGRYVLDVGIAVLATYYNNAAKILTLGNYGEWGVYDKRTLQEANWGAVTTEFSHGYSGTGECFGVEVDFSGDYTNQKVIKQSDNRMVSGSVDCIGNNTPTITIAFTIAPPEKDAEIFLMVREAIAKHCYTKKGDKAFPTSLDSLKALVLKEAKGSGL